VVLPYSQELYEMHYLGIPVDPSPPVVARMLVGDNAVEPLQLGAGLAVASRRCHAPAHPA
jgi:hypothetical protein